MHAFKLFLLVTSSVKFSGTLGNNIAKKKKEEKKGTLFECQCI